MEAYHSAEHMPGDLVTMKLAAWLRRYGIVSPLSQIDLLYLPIALGLAVELVTGQGL